MPGTGSGAQGSMHEMVLREEGGIFRAFKAYINGEITPTNLGFNLKGCILGLLFRGAFLALGVPNRATHPKWGCSYKTP